MIQQVESKKPLKEELKHAIGQYKKSINRDDPDLPALFEFQSDRFIHCAFLLCPPVGNNEKDQKKKACV